MAVDPWKVKGDLKADVILVTHSHYDHLSIEDINRISKPDTVAAGPADVTSEIDEIKTMTLRAGDIVNLPGISVTAVPAYNKNKSFHPEGNGWLGYIIEMDGEKIYIAGDTDLIPEMDSVKADIVIVPVGGTYTMNASEAAEAVNIIGPGVAIPYHYGDIVGDNTDADLFASYVKNAQVKILNQEF